MTSKRVNFHELPRFIELDHMSREAAVEYANDTLRSEYWWAVRCIAAEAVDEFPNDEDRREEWIEESVDGSEWIIYTHRNLQVLRYTENDEAYFDLGGGSMEDVQHASQVYMRIAFHAMREDVRQHVESLQK